MAQPTFDYDAHWKQVDSLAAQRLNKEAAALSARIEAVALAEGNELQAMRGLLHVMRFRQTFTEKSDSLSVAAIRLRIAETSGASRAIWQSLLAETYMAYYQQNSWTIMNRPAQEKPGLDIATWDAATFLRESGHLYLASLAPAAALRALPVADYAPLLRQVETSDRYRPTLYDLLVHRALDHFASTANELPEPTTPFALPVAQALLPAHRFVEEAFTSPDTSLNRYRIVRLYQDLLRFHLGREAPYAIVDLDLKRLAYVKEAATGPDKETAYLAALEQLAGWYSHHPVVADVTYEIARWYVRQAEGYDPFARDAKGQDSYRQAFDRCRQMVNKYPDSRGGQNCIALMSHIREQKLSLEGESYVYPRQPFRVSVLYRNLDRVFFRAVRLTPTLKEKLDELRYERAAYLAFLRQMPTVRSWTQPLPEARDYHPHRTEIAALGLEPGHYLLLAADNRDFNSDGHAVAVLDVQVTTMAATGYRSDDDRWVYYLTDRQQGKPLPGVMVKLSELRQEGSNSRTAVERVRYTDAEGRVVIDDLPLRTRIEVHFGEGEDVLSAGTSYIYRRGEPVPPQAREVFFTDRRIYRPGQRIYFKVIALEQDGDAVQIRTQQPLTVSLYDVNGQKVQTLELTTNAYGSASGTFVAPSTGLTGNMSLRTENGQHDFSVEEYKRPTFELRFEPVTGEYALGQAVTVPGEAVAYSGAKLDGATVSYRVVREARYPYWFYWGRRPPRAASAEIAQGELQTDADGAFSVTFDLRPDASLDPADKPVFTYTLYADVTDITGETQSAQTSLRAGYLSLEVDLTLPEQVYQEALPPWRLSAHNLSGAPQAAAGTLTLYPLSAPNRNFRSRQWARPDLHLLTQAEYEKRFPRDLYAQENQRESWPVGEPLFRQTLQWTGDSSLTLDRLAQAPAGAYKAVLALDDGTEIVRFFTLTPRRDAPPALPTWLKVHPDQTQAEPGDILRVALQTSEASLWVQYQVSQNGEILDESLLELSPAGALLSIPVEESHRGGLVLSFTAVRYGQVIKQTTSLAVPWTHKQLSLSWQTFRSELQPGQAEEWRLRVRGSQAEAVAAEMVATLYDASLDVFRPNHFGLSLYPHYGRQLNQVAAGFGANRSQLYAKDWNTYPATQTQGYDQFDWCGFSLESRLSRFRGGAMPAMAMAVRSEYGGDSDQDGVPDVADVEPNSPGAEQAEDIGADASPAAPATPPALRRNLDETAFFFPHLQTNAEGEIVLAFTLPEALTRWRFLGLAHTQDLRIGTLGGETVTQKDLMVVPNLPRFVREGDRILLTAKVVNLAERELTGSVRLSLLDALRMEPAEAAFQLTGATQSFTVGAGRSVVVTWTLAVPVGGPQALMTRVVAEAGDFSDGQENVLPILSNRMLVTETQPLMIRGRKKRQTVTFDKLLAAGQSPTLQHERLTLEMTTNPAWYAVQALPYLMEFPHACTEQIYSRLYANALATHIATSTPGLQAVFQQWQALPAEVALQSNLEKNPDLKNALLTETPWVLQAQNEAERKRQIGVLFDLGRMSRELEQAGRQLAERQAYNGAFSWFPGMPESRYMTQLIATGIGQLDRLGISISGDQERTGLGLAAVRYLDMQIAEDYRRLQDQQADMEANHLSTTQVQYLYMRSYYDAATLKDATREAYDYYYGQAQRYWNKQNLYMMGMLALVFHRNGDAELAAQLIEALRQNAVTNPKLGMYWKGEGGYYWYQAPIERQALFLEAFDEVAGDVEAVEEMKVWLLQNKRTNDWGTTRATAAACQALLQRGDNWLGAAPAVEISLGDQTVSPATRPDVQEEAGTGYFRTTWTGDEIQPEMGKVKLRREGRGLAWGALYWQYFEQMDRITYAETPLSIRRQLAVETNTPNGPSLRPLEPGQALSPGDKLTVRIELRVDRDMEYVHLKDLRAAGLEPINVMSQYRYQGGLGFYESTRDAATHFFFDYLPQGTWVLEYSLRVNHQGDFSHGIATAQCMYAPEFSSHSEGLRLEVKK